MASLIGTVFDAETRVDAKWLLVNQLVTSGGADLTLLGYDLSTLI